MAALFQAPGVILVLVFFVLDIHARVDDNVTVVFEVFFTHFRNKRAMFAKKQPISMKKSIAVKKVGIPKRMGIIKETIEGRSMQNDKTRI